MSKKMRAELIRWFKADDWDFRKGVMVLPNGTLVPVGGSTACH